MNPTLLASYLVQAAGALITAAIFGGFFREYRRPFLRDWAIGWAALCVMLLFAGASQLYGANLPVGSFSRVATAGMSCAMGYLTVVWLRFGSAALSGDTTYSRSKRIAFSAAALLLGITLASIHTTDPSGVEIRYFLREGLRNLAIGIAFIVAALQVWRAAGVHRIGRRIVVWAFILFGISRIILVWVGLFVAPTSIHPAHTLFIGFSEFVLIFTMGLGVVIWLLEEQHSAAQANAAQVEQLAFRDALTGLPNRKLFLDHLNLAVPQARRAKHKLAVFFIDLDRFKIVNDSLGHSVGDKVLQVVAARIRATLRETDTVARMGGDEFTVLAPVVHTIEDAILVARKVHEAIKEPVAIEGRELFITVSIGISIFPDDGSDAEALLRASDTAMYRAKAQGADLFQLYTAEMNSHAIQQLALESALRRGVESLEFVLHYQPIVRTRDGAVHAMEAMLRWKHPVLGLVHPEQFLRLAESTGMIVPIGEWALRAACRQLALWRAEGFLDLRMAVNLSTRQLQQPGLVEFVRGVLEETNLPASALELEIDETSATESGVDAVEQLRALKELGAHISIDDFGTGYSSLSSLRTFPVDVLKIDTSFVRNLVRDANDTAIAIAVIALAKSLGLRVVAEGVEQTAQLDFLHLQNCEFWQGYLCCAPVEPSEARAVLRRMSATGGRILSPVVSKAISP